MDGSVVSQMLLDVDRLAVAGSLACRSMTTDELIEATGRDRRTVLTALGDLRSARLVVADTADRYALDVDALRRGAQVAAELSIPMDPAIGFGMTGDEQRVLGRYFSGRVLSRIPTSRAKLIVVLQRLVLEFDVGRRYTEREVNELLQPFNRDCSALRRGLVDEGLLDREHADDEIWYWRSGGRVPLDSD